MSERSAKRFWKQAEASRVDGGWAITLDGRPVRTPAKISLVVPTRALAEGIAAEWDAQTDRITPETMPLTRSANATIDKVATQFDEVAELISAYGETDLCCYRADAPERLVARQSEAWDPLLDWAESRLSVRLTPTTGVMPVSQSAESLAELRRVVAQIDAFGLTALHDLVSLSGSLIIGLAALESALPVEELWRRSRIDETWQEAQWGVDEEAAALAARKRGEFLQAAIFFNLSRPTA